MELTLFDQPSVDMLHYEFAALRQGFQKIAGIDEAGRGPLAGPVVAAAVVLPNGHRITGVTDSKKLSARQRDRLFELIMGEAVAVGTGVIDAPTIDRVNILQATLLAMKTAVEQLPEQPDYLLIDGISQVPLPYRQKTIKKGDSLSLSIAAASIIAKVTRDRLMEEYDRQYPGYCFSGHKGYGSSAHLAAIAELGPSPIHRLTFRGVKEHVINEIFR